MSHVTVITGAERRRRWSDGERLRILEAAFTPGAVVADVARRYDVCTSLIYKWRRAADAAASSVLVPVVVSSSKILGPRCGGSDPAIVIEFSGGARVTVGADAPAALVSAVLKALR